MEKWPGSEEPEETVGTKSGGRDQVMTQQGVCAGKRLALANGLGQSVSELLAAHPPHAERLGDALMPFMQSRQYECDVLIQYEWNDLGSGTVIDVGSSDGFASIAIAEHFPDLNLVVQNLEPVTAGAEAAVPAASKERVSFMTHNFLTEQPVKHADAYLFRWILHNWSDKFAAAILRSLMPALRPGARTIVMENVLPRSGEMYAWTEERVRSWIRP